MPSVNPLIFKAYDIRGIYPDEINEETVRSVSRAFVFWLRRKIKKTPKIVLSRDIRNSSPFLHKAALMALGKAGASVIDAGLTTTPMHYFIVNKEKTDGGLMITASHNPKEYNGIKLSQRGAMPVFEANGLLEIKKMVVEAGADHPERSEQKYEVARKNYLSDYVNFLAKFASPEVKKLRVAIDCGSGMTGLVAPSLFKKIRIKYDGLYLKPDGNFPYHEANPLKEETLHDLKSLMKKKFFDLGVAFDGDGDRATFLNERGEVIFASFILALTSKDFLKNRPGQTILYDFRSSRIVPETIKKCGGRALPVRVGHSFIKQKMRRQKALFAGELSGHYFFRDFFYCDSALMMTVKILNILARSGQKLSELIAPFKKYWHSGEINFRVKNDIEKENKLKTILKKYKAGKQDWPDGLLFKFSDFWFSVRPSNTEPLLRLVLEADCQKTMEEKVREIRSILNK